MRERRPRSFRRSLSWNLLSMVVLLGVVSVALGWLALRESARQASQAIMAEVADAQALANAEFYATAQRSFVLVEYWVRNRWNGAWDTYEFDRVFPPFLLAFEDASALYLGRQQGDGYILSRVDGRWVSWTIRPLAFGDQGLVRSWTDEAPVPDEGWQKVTFDLSRQSWFEGAMALLGAGAVGPLTSRVFEAEPGAAPLSGRPGRVLSFAARTDLGDRFVFGFERSLAKLTERLQQLKVLDEGVVAVLHAPGGTGGDAVFLGVPADTSLVDRASAEALILRSPSMLGGSIAAFVASSGEAALEQAAARRFESDGAAWWGMARRLTQNVFDLPEEQASRIVVAVPERDLLRRLPQLGWALVVVTALVGCVAVWRAFRLAHSYSAPVDALVDQSRRLQRLDFSQPMVGRSDIAELGILADTLESTRRSLGAYASISEEVRIADAIVRGALPSSFDRPDGYEIEGSWQPAEETGGEMFDVLAQGDPAAPGTALMLLAPESFGIEVAVLSAQLRAVFRTSCRAGGDVDRILRQLDAFAIHDVRETGRICAWLAMLDSAGHRLIHVAPGLTGNLLHWRSADRRVGIRPVSASPLGASSGRSERPAEELALARGDIVLVVSHGVIEALSQDRERFGTERLAALLHDRADAPAIELVSAIERALEAFMGERRPTRDRTMLVLRRQP